MKNINKFSLAPTKTVTKWGYIFGTDLHSDFISSVSNALKLYCVKNVYNFIENSKILSDNLWQDGLYLNNSGKCKLF